MPLAQLHEIEQEIKQMRQFTHPLIVKIIDDFIDSDGHLCKVQEFYPDGDFR